MAYRRMIFDTANLLFRIHAAQSYKATTNEDSAGLAMHIMLNTIKGYYKKFGPDQLAVTFEGSENWRKAYTASDACVSKRIYKANRVKDDSMIPFFELIKAFEELVRNHTSLVCLSHPKVEGDDLIGGYAQRFANTDDEIIIVSGDKDFKQLLKFKNVTLIDPDSGKPRECDDPEYFMFEKCFRGDTGDNVMSAYPRVRATKLQKAYNDEYALTQLWNESWSMTDPETGIKTSFKVGDLFLENDLLMNLESQPEEIKKIINDTLDYELVHHGKFSNFHFMKFCGKYGLNSIAEQATTFNEVLSVTGRNSPHKNENKEYLAKKKADSLLEY